MLNSHSQKDHKFVFKTYYFLIQAKSIAECANGSILQYFRPSFIKLPILIKIFVLSIFEWPFYTGFTVFLMHGHRQSSLIRNKVDFFMEC